MIWKENTFAVKRYISIFDNLIAMFHGRDNKDFFAWDVNMIGIVHDVAILHDNLTLWVVMFSLEIKDSTVITYAKAEKKWTIWFYLSIR